MNYSILKPLYKINLPVHVFAVRKLNPLLKLKVCIVSTTQITSKKAEKSAKPIMLKINRTPNSPLSLLTNGFFIALRSSGQVKLFYLVLLIY